MKYTNEQRLEFARSREPKEGKNIIGYHCDIHPTAIVGKNGFGYVRDEAGKLVDMPHQGGVIIGNYVTIGAHTCIDRAVEGFTLIGGGTKIDNLVHVGHGAMIGEDCLIVAGTVIGGSAEIGDRCFLGMGCLIKNKVKIGNDVTVGMGAVVTKDVPDGWTVIGNPARRLEKDPPPPPPPGIPPDLEVRH